jgi:hypothetical protein
MTNLFYLFSIFFITICIIEIDSSCIKKPTELKGDSLYQLRSPMAGGGEP